GRQAPPLPGDALTAASAVRKSRGRDEGSRNERQDVVILDWAVMNNAANTASPCIRSGALPGPQILHARVKARPSKDGTRLQKRDERTQGRSGSHVCHGCGRTSLRADV